MNDELVLLNLIARAKTKYTCNRGPRPSGAVIHISTPVRHCIICGDVTPTDGSKSCNEIGCMIVGGHCVRNIHAEVDALLEAAKAGIATDGAVMYSINKPCYNCTLACIKAGITAIYYAYAVYDEQRTENALNVAGVKCIHVPIN